MRIRSWFGRTLILFAAAAPAQQTATAPPASAQIAPNERFYKTYQITPIGNGEKVVFVLDAGTQQFNIYGAEPVPAKDGGAVTQWTLSSNGFMTVYSKKSIVIPDPNGGEGTTIEGMSVVNLSSPAPSAPKERCRRWAAIPAASRNWPPTSPVTRRCSAGAFCVPI